VGYGRRGGDGVERDHEYDVNYEILAALYLNQEKRSTRTLELCF
jgi:hypothetical protein